MWIFPRRVVGKGGETRTDAHHELEKKGVDLSQGGKASQGTLASQRDAPACRRELTGIPRDRKGPGSMRSSCRGKRGRS